MVRDEYPGHGSRQENYEAVAGALKSPWMIRELSETSHAQNAGGAEACNLKISSFEFPGTIPFGQFLTQLSDQIARGLEDNSES